MNTVEFLSHLRALDIAVHLDGDQLKIDAPKGQLSTSLRDELIARKGDILDLLRASSRAAQKEMPIDRLPVGAVRPLSHAQQRMWLLDQLQPGNPAYAMASAARIGGTLDVASLQASLSEIVRRHETLRAQFVIRDQVPRLLVRDPAAVDLPLTDLSRLPQEKREPQARLLAATEAGRPFDLTTDPLLRVRLLRLAADDHVLLVIFHHIVFDGWSAGIFSRELSALYEAFSAGIASPLPDLPIQYSDFAAWQRDWLTRAEFDSDLAYWRTALEGAPPHLDLPTDRLRPAVETHRGATYSFELGKAISDALGALSLHEGVTPFMTLLAVFQMLLSRYTGQEDIVVGSPVANRTRPEVEGLIGFFVNTLLLRTRFAPEQTFRELLRRVRGVCLGAYAHQNLPFEQLVEALKPPRDMSRNPLFQVMFVLQNMDRSAPSLGDLKVSPFEFNRTTSQLDLSLYMWETDAGLQGRFEYSTDLFDAQTIEQMTVHFQRLLEAAIATPDGVISRLPLLPDAERERLLEEFNRTSRRYPREQTVVELFASQARRVSDRTAVVCGGTELTYAELDSRSDAVAGRLQSLGIGPGSLVGLCIQRSADLVAAVLGIWKAGGAYLPLDPTFPVERRRYMLEDSGAAALIAHGQLDGLPDGVRCIGLDDLQGGEGGRAQAAITANAEKRAYVIYTSGSTGLPKGVEVSHRALTNFLTSMAAEPGFGEHDVLAAVTTISFDISLLELFLPLTVGGQVAVASSDALVDGRQLELLLRESGATVMQATPSLWRVLVAAGWTGGTTFKALCGGEPFPPDLAAQLSERCAEVWNMYGPTETTVWSTCERIGDPDARISIGKPIANTQIYVLDRAAEPVPPLVAGELFIGGDGVALGYLNRPELTEERFLLDPFAGQPGRRIYKTGDKARWLPDGRLEHLGRLDDQVKVRGFRIELGEIEASLRTHPSVREAAVSVLDVGAGDQRLVAYVVSQDGTVPAADLRKHLRSTLPDYMIPQNFVGLDSLPLTANGKLDRKALPSPLRGGASELRDANPPAGPTEQLIASVWKEVIGNVQVSRGDNFFDLGGHSLLAIKAIALIEERTGWRPPARLLILESLQEIALRCDEARKPHPRSAGLLSRLKGLVRVGG